MIRADLTLADARLGSDFPQFTRTKRKRPDDRGAPKLQPVRPSGSQLGRLDLQDLAGARNRDLPRLHRLWDLAHEIDVEKPVL